MTIVDFNKSGNGPDGDITEQAYYWAAKLDGEPSKAQLRDFNQWLADDVAHQQEFKRVATMWDGLDDYLSDLLSQAEAPLPQTVNVGEARTALPFRFGLAACTLVAVALVTVFLANHFPWNSYHQTHTTVVGEIRQVGLPDGSDVQLNTNTQAEIDYQDNARLVRLVAGEAHFNVAHQPDKPFVVYAGDIAVKAVGTAFSVYIKDDGNVEVIVSEGTVELSAIDGLPTSKLAPLEQLQAPKALGRFTKGQRTLLADSVKSVEKKSEQELTRELSWRTGMLIFDEQPLDEVVREVSRYTDTEIVVDESIRNMAIGGYFPAGKTDILLSTLEESFGIHVNRLNPSVVQLSPKIPEASTP